MTDAVRPSSRLLFVVALAAFAADVLLFRLTVSPLGIAGQYLVRGLAAVTFLAALQLRSRVPPDTFGLGFGGLKSDALWLLRAVGVLAVVSVVLMALAVGVLRILRPPLDGWPLETRQPEWFLNSILLAPVIEELVYRGLMVPGFVEAYGRRGAVAAGALVFYALHLAYGTPLWMVHHLVGGAILTWAFVARRKLWICAALHAGANLLVVVDDAVLRWSPALFEAIVGGRP